ncbi:MAG: cyclic nucleotide-binding domain-containing protein [Planctomycetales bacterium]
MLTTEAIVERCPLFQDMSAAERSAVFSLLESVTYTAGETILREGKAVRMLWIIRRGQCEVVKKTKTGVEQRLAILEQGAVFGEMSFFHPAPHSASIRTLDAVEVLRLTLEEFKQLEEVHPSAAHRIVTNTVTVLVGRLRRMDEWVRDLLETPEAAGHREEWQEFRAKLYSEWLK